MIPVRFASRLACALLVLTGLLTMPGPLTSQVTPVRPERVDLRPALGERAPQEPVGVPGFASAWLPPGHWAEGALRRLYAMGLLEAHDLGRRRIPVREAAAAFQEALQRAPLVDPRLLDLLAAWQSRFTEEFGALERMGGRDLVYHGAADAAWETREGDLALAPDTAAAVPTPVEDRDRFLFTGHATASWTRYFAVGYTGGRPRIEGGDFQELYAVGQWRGIGAWLGRRAPGYGPAVSGTTTLEVGTELDGGGLFLADPWEPIGFLGPLRLETSLGRVPDVGPVRDPWFWTARFSAQPHARFGIGISRAALFGGEDGQPLTLENLIFLAIGKHGSGGSNFENQVAAVDLWLRPPLGRLPLLAWLEWGFDDSAGAWMDTPGIIAGLELAAVPGAPALALGIERTSFAESCCGNPAWYRHQFFGPWAESGRTIAHPLGGHGTEWTAFGRLDALDARARLTARIFQREREEENLFTPDRLGTATGGSFELLFRWSPSLDLRLGGFIENGDDDWRETYAAIGARALF